jgi:hypothetical protein
MKSTVKNAKEMSDQFKYRKSRCHDCAFTKGTEANTSGVTSIKATLCAEVPEPFYCHFNADGNELADGKEVLCQGWVESCNILASLGHYESQADWQRDHKQKLLEGINQIEEKGLNGYEGIHLINQLISGKVVDLGVDERSESL